jgi:hypothetical protein
MIVVVRYFIETVMAISRLRLLQSIERKLHLARFVEK